jgi:hypothetical protein
LGTGVDALPAANAFLFVDSPHIAVGRIHVTRTGRAIMDAKRGNALPAYRHDNIVGVLGERRGITDYLDSGYRGIPLSLMGHRAGKHATLAAKAQPAVIDNVPGGWRIGCFRRRGCRNTCGQDAGRNGSPAADQKIASQNRFILTSAYLGFGHGGVSFISECRSLRPLSSSRLVLKQAQVRKRTLKQMLKGWSSKHVRSRLPDLRSMPIPSLWVKKIKSYGANEASLALFACLHASVFSCNRFLLDQADEIAQANFRNDS